MASWDKEIESGIYDITYFFIGLVKVFFLGMKQSIKKKNIVFIPLAVVVGIGVYFFIIPANKLVVFVPLLIVVMFLGLQRHSQIEEYYKAFESVGFKGKDGKYPYCISTVEKNNRTSTYFKSNIPLPMWQKNKEALQTALNCVILDIQAGNSKKIVRVTSVKSDYKLPKKIKWDDTKLIDSESKIILGESYAGLISFDFNSTPHWILAGSTGSGKSVLLRSIVYQCLIKDHRVILMDFKRGVEFGKAYDDFCEVILEKKRAVELLTWLVEENKRRLDLFRNAGIKDITDYNKKHKDDPMKRIVVLIDELAILLIATHEKGDGQLTALATDSLENIAILGRAAGIDMVFGIQRPDANTVTGQIKSNVSGRVCGYFADGVASMIVLNNTKATEIDPDKKGRFMYQNGRETIEFQAYYQVEEDLIESVLNHKCSGAAPEIMEEQPLKKITKKRRHSEEQYSFDTDYENIGQ